MNILTFATHEGYQSNLARTGHTFYLLNCPERPKGWKIEECPLPDNFIPSDIKDVDLSKIDVIISNSAFEQRELINNFPDNKIPIIETEHCLPLEHHLPYLIEIKRMCKAKIKVFTTIEQAKIWKYGDGDNYRIVGHAPQNDFLNKEWERKNDKVLSVAYNFKDRDDILGYNEWKSIANCFDCLHIGDKIIASQKELLELYSECAIFLNTAKWSTLPTSLLEAMAVGIPTVSIDSVATFFIDNGKNGFKSNDVLEIISMIDFLLSNPKKAKEIGQNGKETIKKMFNIEKFVQNWQSVIGEAIKC